MALDPFSSAGGHVSEWKVHAPPAKNSRRRIVCPTLTSGAAEERRILPRFSPERTLSSILPKPLDERPTPSMPLLVGVRVLYFSRDGAQADTGNLLDIQVSTSTTVEALLRRVREVVGCGEKGKLLFKMRPLTDANATLDKVGVTRDPQGLHLMLSRKHRPEEIADKAASAAAELSSAMEAAAAEATARGPRQKAPRPQSGCSSVTSEAPC
mmetsp:Transcript_24231/g.43341  ORF Transcript_24231/g.43341 Transcript_24231/m.43341 type:complete len:211 (+) Transcript_24231:120-752(+)